MLSCAHYKRLKSFKIIKPDIFCVRSNYGTVLSRVCSRSYHSNCQNLSPFYLTALARRTGPANNAKTKTLKIVDIWSVFTPLVTNIYPYDILAPRSMRARRSSRSDGVHGAVVAVVDLAEDSR